MSFFSGFKRLTCLTLLLTVLFAGGFTFTSLPVFANTANPEEAVKSEGTTTEAVKEGEKKVEYPPAPKLTVADYPQIGSFNPRILVWIVAQLHLWFAAFVLAVPIFVLIIEALGMATKDQRYDNMAYEFIKVSMAAYSITAIIGGLLTFSLLVFYPDLFKYMASLFSRSMLAYAFLFFAESASLYIYYYGWHWLEGGFKKWVHLTIGLVLNFVCTVLMMLANAWVSF